MLVYMHTNTCAHTHVHTLIYRTHIYMHMENRKRGEMIRLMDIK